MSFSADIKKELSALPIVPRHCCHAELSAFLLPYLQQDLLLCRSENPSVMKRIFKIVKEVFHVPIKLRISYSRFKKNRNYELFATQKHELLTLKQAVGLTENGFDQTFILLKDCCKRSYLRALFLVCGSISNPEKSYHLEFVLYEKQAAIQIKKIIESVELKPKISMRKNHYMIYIKESDQIALFLNLIGAHQQLMHFENIRIMKEMRNDVNRSLNFEIANLNKTVEASTQQIEDIRFLIKKGRFHHLSSALQTTAQLRIDHPEASLKELGQLHKPPIGKSGINHRLRKISEFANTT